MSPSATTPRSRRAHYLVTAAFVGTCFVLFAFFRPAPDADEPYVFAMSVENDAGDVLASPVVVGSAGRKVEVRMVCESDPRAERMSLVLEPLSEPDGQLAYAYDLSVPGHVDHARGTVHLKKGAEQHIAVDPQGAKQGISLALYAAPLKAPGVAKYLKARRVKLGRTAT